MLEKTHCVNRNSIPKCIKILYKMLFNCLRNDMKNEKDWECVAQMPRGAQSLTAARINPDLLASTFLSSTVPCVLPWASRISLNSTLVHTLTHDRVLWSPTQLPLSEPQENWLHSRYQRAWKYCPDSFVLFSCNYFIWERPSRVSAFVFGGGGPRQSSQGMAEKPRGSTVITSPHLFSLKLCTFD